tara:strand:+ start:843 stop:1397 length:555 start_codon:yes stop_codon:yes gene_type:complete
MVETSLNSISIQKGPSGRAMSQPMEEGLVEAFFQHLSMERNANAQYFAISIWFALKEFRGFSSFFNNESQSEIQHAMNFANYLIARGQNVKLNEISEPRQHWDSIEDAISFSFQMEADVTSSLHQLYSMAERSCDTRTNVFLDPVIESQTKAEDEFAHLLGRVNFANNQPSALFIIDSDLLGAK